MTHNTIADALTVCAKARDAAQGKLERLKKFLEWLKGETLAVQVGFVEQHTRAATYRRRALAEVLDVGS